MGTVSDGLVIVVAGKYRQTARGGVPPGRREGSHAADDRSIVAGAALAVLILLSTAARWPRRNLPNARTRAHSDEFRDQGHRPCLRSAARHASSCDRSSLATHRLPIAPGRWEIWKLRSKTTADGFSPLPNAQQADGQDESSRVRKKGEKQTENGESSQLGRAR